MSKFQRPKDAGESSSRREFLGEVGMVLGASLIPGAAIFAAPSGVGRELPPSDIRHHGVVPNSVEAAAANTAALAALVIPTGSFSGQLVFPNTTGRDVYYFNDMIPFHDGVHIDLMGSTLNFSKTGTARDTNAGFLHAIRDFSIENGSIVVDYTHKAGFNTGNALSFGGRGNDCPLFLNIYDSLLPASMGKIVVRNLHISSNADGGEGRAIFLLGGLDGVLLENVSIDGQNKLLHGIYYEFGWATNEAKPYLRQTSHAHNVQIKNLEVKGVINEGFAANGMYRAVVDGIKVTDAGGVCAFGAGESMFYRVWSGVGDRKSKPNIMMRNVVGESIRNVGVGVTGASKFSASYLDNPPAHDNPNGLTAMHQTDLMEFTLDTFSIEGTANNYGISTSAGRAVIRNGTLKGFQRGIVTSQECTKFIIEKVTVLNSTGLGMQLGRPESLHSPPRQATGVVRACVVTGSGASSPSAAMAIGTTQCCIVEGCQFGNDSSERTQTQAVVVAADAFEVSCRDNFVHGTANNSAAYVLTPGPAGARQCRLVRNGGIVTATGAWLTGRQGLAVQAVADGGTIVTAGMHSVWIAATEKVRKVGVQPGAQPGQVIVLINEGAAENAIEFGAPSASNVAEGVEAIAGLTSRIMIWNAENKLWHSFNS